MMYVYQVVLNVIVITLVVEIIVGPTQPTVKMGIGIVDSLRLNARTLYMHVGL